MDSDSQDTDEGVELSPIADYPDVYPGEFTYNEDSQQPAWLEARTVYVLMPKNVPVSRCTRLQWLLEHLNTIITVPSFFKNNHACNDLEVISAVPIEATNFKTSQFLITNATEVIFLAQSYRFVYCLDMSPSQSAIDIQKGVILFDEILTCFKSSLEGLCRQFTIPGNSLAFHPCINLTVIVNTPFFMSPAQQVLVKGVQITSKNVHEIINLVATQFSQLEDRISHVSALAHDQLDLQKAQSEGIVGGLFDLPENEQIVPNVPIVSPDANFVNMLRYSMLAISLLPENSLSHILVITDGVIAMPDSNIMESLLYQLHYDSIALSFLKVGSSFHPHSSAGYISYTDLLYFLSQCTLGSCLENITPVIREPSMTMNVYHELYLLWSFYAKNRYVSHHRLLYNGNRWDAANHMYPGSQMPSLLSKRQTEENINASILVLLARRMREGYTVDSINLTNGLLDVKLSLQWKSFIYIQYSVTSQWPIVKNVAHFEVQISAPYEFLFDITCLIKKESKSSYRQSVIERFWIRLTQLTSTDSALAQQLTSFQCSNVWYTLPESVRSGIPVFILNNNIIHDACKLVLTPSDIYCPKFVNVWQPICQMETNSWRKWFHTQKLSLILKHDHPLPKHLHLSNSSGRFQVVQCRQAATALYGLLSKWASFILIDNNTYLKLLHAENDKPPTWFCIIRVSSKLPCVVLNIGFITGTPGHIRQKICDELKIQLSLLSYHSSPPKSKENICCTLLQKPLEKFLIRYERLPSDFNTVIFPDGTQPPHNSQSLPTSPFTGTLFTTLSRYLYHKRWVWSATHSSNLKLDHTAVSRILNTLTRMRLKEGFNFAHSSSGIITMVLELWMETSFSCIVQYVLFPPHSVLWGEGELCSGSEEEIEADLESETELQMVTEVWIEPQFGVVKSSNPRICYLTNKPYYDLADAIKEMDLHCIRSLLTLEHISLMCQDKRVHRLSINSRIGKTSFLKNSTNSLIDYFPPLPDNESQWNSSSSQRIQHIPFKFDSINILPLCHQCELLFSMFIEGRSRHTFSKQKNTVRANSILMKNIQYHLQCIHDRELTMSQEESDRFTLHVLKRHRNKHPNICPISENFRKGFQCNENKSESQWRCFIKGISTTHVILTFIPASLQDLKNLTSFELQAGFIENLDNNDRTSSRGSNYSDVPINSSNYLVLPIYVFDCPLSLLVDAYVNDVDYLNNTNKDVYEDHRYNMEMPIQDVIRLKTDDVSSISPEPKSEESENSDSKSNTKLHCRALVLMFSKCFTMSLFSALHMDLFIHNSDVQAARDQCVETAYEVDITEYIKTVCGHLKQLKENRIDIDSLKVATPCRELRSLHSLIKEKFLKTISVAFKPVPTNTDFYYCRNLTLEKSDDKQNDSDDEISNHPSEIVEFSINNSQPLQRMESGISEIVASEVSPLFLHLICSMHCNNWVANTSVEVLPTCLGEVIHSFQTGSDYLELPKLKVTLDILCLTLPLDVQNVINDFSPRGLRTTSFCSDFQPNGASSASEASYLSDIKETEPIIHLPDLQRQAIISLREEIEWLLVDEIVTSLLDIYPVTTNTLNYVMKHVTTSAGKRFSCILDIIDLNFVYGSNKSYEKFVQEFSKVKLNQYTLCKQGDIYYLVKQLSSRERKESGCFVNPTLHDKIKDSEALKESVKIKMDALKSGTSVDEQSENQLEGSEVTSRHSDSSSLNGSEIGTDGGYEEDVSEEDDDYDWLIHLDNKRQHLPNFWLIMQIEQERVTIYFHCRFLELQTTLVATYIGVQRAVSDAVRDLCKRVNQSLLLQTLYETRTCDHLLEPEDSFKDWHVDGNAPNIIRNSSFSRLKSMDEASDEYENYPTALLEANLKFKPGYFSCPVVWETPFVLHPRLKVGPGKPGISRGILALKNILDKFSVSNRDNMFVYRDNNSNVFYLRLHENVQNNCSNKLVTTKSSEYEHPAVSRSPSIASLPLGQNKSTLNQSEYSTSSATSLELRPRVRSFGEKETNDLPNEDTLVLKVHGITEAGEDVRCELVQVLQNRLDDAVLESLSIMLARNAMCPLTREDVHFLQKPFRLPELIIRVSVQEFSLKWLDSFMHYLRQNLLQFLNIPKYTDNRCHYHFKDYSESEQISNKMKDDNIFIYNQSQNPSSGSRGIACIALAIINHSEESCDNLSKKCDEMFESKKFEEMVSSCMIDNKDILPSTYLEFRLWKQGRVNIDNLSEKLKTATSQATWDIIMEHYLLQAPLCVEDNQDAQRPLLMPNRLNSETLIKPIADDAFVDFECSTLLDLSFSNKNIPVSNLYSSRKIDSTALSRRRKRLTGTSSTMQRSSSATDENKDSTDMSKTSADWKTCIKLDFFELGDKGKLSNTYAINLQDWLEFGVTLATPAVKKHKVMLTSKHLTGITIKEIQSLISQLSKESAKAFSPMSEPQHNTTIYIPHPNTSFTQKCIVISRNFEQWKACVAFNGSVDFPSLFNTNTLKHMQKFCPSVTLNNIFIPRQKIFWAVIQSDCILLYTYNWSKDNVDKLLDYTTNLGMWLSARSSFLNSITAQKLGLFCNQPITRKAFLPSNNPYVSFIGDGDHMLKFPKDRSRRIGTLGVNNPSVMMLEAFRDSYKHTRYSSDPVIMFTIEMLDIKRSDKKFREDLKKLHAMYQTRSSASTMQQIQILIQNSRVIHFCHTPLLFLPRWRLQSAATRDHSLNQQGQISSFSSPQSSQENENWHQELCYSFISEYKRYLQTLGFMPLQLENLTKKLNKKDLIQHESVCYMQKVILGGILMFSINLEEPFFITKLYAAECSRLQSTTTSRASVNRFTLSFLDECDRVRVLMHLHSFAYDFHLRSIFNYVSNNTSDNKICERYHITHFLDDFMKYYNKAPNFARNLVYADTITIRNLMTEGKQLYDYLLTNVTQYNFDVFTMGSEDPKDTEYVLVQVTNTHQVSYKDLYDRQHTDDFDVTVIICNLCSPYVPWDNVLHLKYYLILISKKEIYPKSEVERTLGKFQTVTNTIKTVFSNEKSLDNENSQYTRIESECEASNSAELPTETSGSDEVVKNDKKAQSKDEEKSYSSQSRSEIKQESVNYLGYYSSHEQVMQQLILDCACATQKRIRSMVDKGMVHCRTHLLWNKLVAWDANALTYAEFMELKGLARLENLCDLHPNLHSLLNQPFTWYQGLSKLLLTKYNDQHRTYISSDGNIQHYVILHPRYVGAFMLLSMDLHTSRGDIYAVYREPQKYEDSDMCVADRKALLDGFINCVCFYLWSGMI